MMADKFVSDERLIRSARLRVLSCLCFILARRYYDTGATRKKQIIARQLLFAKGDAACLRGCKIQHKAERLWS